MTAAHRDHRGRFVSADEHAATRLLEAAVREAVRRLRDIAYFEGFTTEWGQGVVAVRRAAAVQILTEAGNCADLLLGVRRG